MPHFAHLLFVRTFLLPAKFNSVWVFFWKMWIYLPQKVIHVQQSYSRKCERMNAQTVKNFPQNNTGIRYPSFSFSHFLSLQILLSQIFFWEKGLCFSKNFSPFFYHKQITTANTLAKKTLVSAKNKNYFDFLLHYLRNKIQESKIECQKSHFYLQHFRFSFSLKNA